jgi:hypothetical protein
MINKNRLHLVDQFVTRIRPVEPRLADAGPPPVRNRPTGAEAALDAAFRFRLMQIADDATVSGTIN